MTDLGTLPGSGSTQSHARAINSGGQVVGGTEAKRRPGEGFGAWGHAFRWAAGKMVDLGTLGSTRSGGSWSRASDLNDRGQIVGWSEPPGSGMRGFLWQAGTMTDLGTLGGDQSVAVAVNERGQVAGYSFVTPKPDDPYQFDHAFLWEDGRMRDLGTLGGRESFANTINERGQIVGSSHVAVGSPGPRHAFIWQGGRMRDLGTLGGEESYAWALNERGQVVGRAQTAGGAWHAYRWQDGKMRDLGTLGGKESDATGINERGQVIGTSSTASGTTHAFLWQDGKMRDLGTLGGRSSDPAAINDRGQVVGTSDTVLPPEPPPQSPHTIAYTALYEAQGAIDPVPGVHTIYTDGSHAWRLIDFAGAPAWSPDGRRIAYTFDSQIVAVARADGKGSQELDAGPSFCDRPTWSPDGRQIACVASWWEGDDRPTVLRSALYAVDLKTGKNRRLLPGVSADATPTWSPDGRRIAFDGNGIVVLDLQTKRTRRIGSGITPDWSPDGKRIAYSTGHAIGVMNADGSGRRTIVTSKELVDEPAWSPDGTRLAYTQSTARAIRGIYIVRTDGKQRRLLVRGGFEPDWRPR
jgi:probable HAF family extracellular repeat protein